MNSKTTKPLSDFLYNKSRFLATVLRHKPELANLTLDSDGYVSVDDVCKELKISKEDLELIVSTNDKKRFAYNHNKTLIRASQGHSVANVDVKLEKVLNPPLKLYHGTKEEFLPSIRKLGLIKGSRHYVHLSDNEITAQQVADRRKGKSVLLIIDANHMRFDGIKFYKSENGVYLVDSVPPQYISGL